MKLAEKLAELSAQQIKEAGIPPKEVAKPTKPKEPHQIHKDYDADIEEDKPLLVVLHEMANAAKVDVAEIINCATFTDLSDYDDYYSEICWGLRYRVSEPDEEFQKRLDQYKVDLAKYKEDYAAYQAWTQYNKPDAQRKKEELAALRKANKEQEEKEKLLKEKSRIEKLLANFK